MSNESNRRAMFHGLKGLGVRFASRQKIHEQAPLSEIKPLRKAREPGPEAAHNTGLEARREAEKQVRNVNRKKRAVLKPAKIAVRCDSRVRDLLIQMAVDATQGDIVSEAIIELAKRRKIEGARELAAELLGGRG